MTRNQFFKLIDSCKYPVTYALDMDTFAPVPFLIGCFQEDKHWIVYENDNQGNVASLIKLNSEEQALKRLAEMLGIIPLSSCVTVPVSCRPRPSSSQSQTLPRVSSYPSRVAYKKNKKRPSLIRVK